jgi:hypothetical protein
MLLQNRGLWHTDHNQPNEDFCEKTDVVIPPKTQDHDFKQSTH